MQQFRFRLQRVLQWQERVCRMEEDQLRQFRAAVAETEEKLARLAAQRVAIEQELASQAALSPGDLRALDEYRRRAVGERHALDREWDARVSLVNAQRDKVVAARKKLHVLEKLRERALQEHTRAADREAEAISLESYLATWIAGQKAS